ncbi:MAG: type II secretion system minor pseudopilin GspJ [Chromatiales bacterium]|jgi:general secretion pathway protein J|nr:type II secretion system minor pseudopilin GspJ [Chromatiales bacterium]MDX9766283.1 type II secretion system minor pseudopilin GspJ [Ectothiorhodospiraceae bacterium]
MTRRGENRGFTLLEVLIALAIFAAVAAMAYGGLRSVLEARAATDAAAARLAELQIALTLIGRDVEQFVDRPTRDLYGNAQPALRWQPYRLPPRFELIRAGGRAVERRSSLRRVGYELEDGVLYRLGWYALDGATDEADERTALFPVEARELRVEDFAVVIYPDGFRLDGGMTPPQEWPAAGSEVQPAAVEVNLEVQGFGTVTRVFALPR